jgi:hypothetical protein
MTLFEKHLRGCSEYEGLVETPKLLGQSEYVASTRKRGREL